MREPPRRPATAPARGRCAEAGSGSGARTSGISIAAPGDRLTAAMADRILVLECGIRSGTMQTVKAGSFLGRPLGCIFPADGSEAAEGHRYMQAHYDAAVIRSREDLLRWTVSSGRMPGLLPCDRQGESPGNILRNTRK